jgi:head-tail adaptor
MASASQRTELIVFERSSGVENEYGEKATAWNELLRRRARVRFGTAQEKREAAQEGGIQSATFECVRSAALDAVTLKDRIRYLPSSTAGQLSAWDLTEIAPLDRATIRFTGTRSV